MMIGSTWWPRILQNHRSTIKLNFMFLAVLLFALPFSGVTYVLVEQKNDDITTIRAEQGGLKYHKALFDIVVAAQRYRNQAFIAANLQKPDPSLPTIKTAVLQTIAATEALDHQIKTRAETHETWQQVKQNLISSLEETSGRTTSETFTNRTIAISDIFDFMNEVATSSLLVLDTQLESYYTADIVTQSLPSLTKYTGDLQGRLASLLTTGKLTDTDKALLQAIYGKIEENRDQYYYATRKLKEKDDDAVSGNRPSITHVVTKINDVLGLFNQISDGDTSITAENFLSASNESILNDVASYLQNLDTLDDYLDKRVEKLSRLRQSIILSAITLFILTISLFITSFRNSVRREELDNARELKAILKALEKAQAVVEFSLDGTIITANQNFLNIFGYTLAEITGKHHSLLIDLTQHNSSEYKKFWDNLRQGDSQFAEFKRITKNGHEVWIQGIYTPILDAVGKPIKVIKFAVDVTERKKAEAKLVLYANAIEQKNIDLAIAKQKTEQESKTVKFLKSVAAMANHTADVNEAIGATLPLVCQFMDWPIGHAYGLNNKDQVLHSTKLWFVENRNTYEQFITVSENKTFKPGEGLPGRVWQQKNSIWITHLGSDSNFPRLKMCPSLDLHSGFAFPVIVDGDVTHVLEFFSSATTQQNSDILEVVKEVGNLLGQVIERAQAKSTQTLMLDKLIEYMPTAVFAKRADDNYRMAIWNTKAESLMGIQRDKVLGTTDYDLFGKTEADNFRQTDTQVMEGGKVIDIPVESITTERGTWLAHTIKVPIYDNEGHPRILLGIMEDITEKKKAEAELHNAAAAAKSANQAKSDFLANMSHEMRTPLNSVIGMVQLMENQDLPKSAQEMLSDIQISSENLLKIVNDILDISKIEASMVELEQRNFDLSQKARHVVRGLLPTASKKGLCLTFNIDNEPLYVTGDSLRFTRILTNLVGNSIRYTDKGAIDVVITSRKNQNNTTHLRCEVHDTGIGIPPNIRDRIFEKFVQADTSTTRRFGGTGLGLAITKELIELMGGTIGVESEFGKGSTFWFELTLPTVDALTPDDDTDNNELTENPHGIPVSDIRILVAEDNDMNQRFITKLFETFGFQHFTIVETGAAAVKAVVDNGYDLVLMDCHMPEMNGYDATIAIRSLHDPARKDTPIVAMTANAMSEDEDFCLRVGMNGYISKPVDIKKFKSVLSRWINFNAPPAAPLNAVEADPAKAENEADVDLSNLIDNSMGDDSFVKEMCELFVTQSAEKLSQLKNQCTNGENQEWVETSHALKGFAANVGAEKMRLLCAEAQNTPVATTETRQVLFASIETEYLKAVKYLVNKKFYVNPTQS